MNTVNRIVVVILLLVAMVLCTITLVFPVRALDAVARQPAALADSLRGFERYSPEWFGRVLLGGLFALTLDIIFGLLIVLEVRRPKPKAIRVEKADGGEVQVSVASIADRLKYEVDQLSSVIRTRPKISAKRGGVVVELNVETAAGIDVPEKARQIVETAQQVVEEKMGLKLARPPKVNLRAVPYSKMPRGRAEWKEEPPAMPYPRTPEASEMSEEDLPALPED
ncbi:MAG: hypothetical protein ACE5OS_06985 [Anaerolineae bacterium]